ncbi:hypothetical protein MSG28_006380 [Choristoneura fumiferana]|uniref:Uncharacterized protein n=1 Tax=Choristoneura fumiferana TaxID=7141 RepID=A0ACC0JEQ8_CHOFU|nr:hypothetical protein MSG28_006380 [Choristoneura fumiferana]
MVEARRGQCDALGSSTQQQENRDRYKWNPDRELHKLVPHRRGQGAHYSSPLHTRGKECCFLRRKQRTPTRGNDLPLFGRVSKATHRRARLRGAGRDARMPTFLQQYQVPPRPRSGDASDDLSAPHGRGRAIFCQYIDD